MSQNSIAKMLKVFCVVVAVVGAFFFFLYAPLLVDELTVMAFRVFDNEELGIGEGNFGMIDENGQIKAIMKEYYIIINGNNDTSSLQAKIDEYFK